MRITWRRERGETGLTSVSAPDRGWDLCIDGARVATVRPLTKPCHHTTVGWYYVALHDDARRIAYANTCKSPDETSDVARQKCKTYVRDYVGLAKKK